ncbi:MAG: pyrroloquinoline quinone biosynthesis peptide chaperone PqqD [Xanthomonadales bacterium]|nr:pyrroloquinoline quinone biosynthesis peptide chaperone PqqD [Xanthomonadales bacterium]
MNSEAKKPCLREDLATEEVDNELIVLHSENGQIHKLNETAAFVLRMCDGNTSVAEIKEQLATRYQVDSSTVSKDVDDLIDSFHALGLIG